MLKSSELLTGVSYMPLCHFLFWI